MNSDRRDHLKRFYGILDALEAAHGGEASTFGELLGASRLAEPWRLFLS